MKKLSVLGLTFFFLLAFAGNVSAQSNASYNWGFMKGKNGKPAEAGAEFDEMLPKYEAVYKGDTSKKDIYLTFDNGYENGYTEGILNVLKKQQVPATFFVTGHYLKTAPELVKRMANEGHIVGNHSWSHPDMTKKTNEVIRKELLKVKEETERLTGVQTMNYLRPPRGVFNERTMKVAKEEGYYHIFWSLAFKDWIVDQQKGSDYSYREVMKQIHPGAILLLHTVSKDNAEALDSIITDLKKKGYTFKSLDDMMAEKELPDFMKY
ncbi:delta-lactam-biosynthetic de-N-acetylase [Bacillus massiliglaciei]|uniref:delta-lactam-biosynthetic de-N-acetylase n=1 Tax=Bacillus massiliglaciei TaxID=1816693 RepID=UPI000A68CACE|nr:delta-lactam-biosynthetic de-N-acetylase [Bacillus massiliglaciei]